MIAKTRFRRLFEPGWIGNIEIPNRIMMSAMMVRLGKNGYITEESKDYYVERARGGVGLIIIETTCIDWRVGRISEEQPSIDDDIFMEGLSELAEIIKGCGPKVALQLHHAGHAAHPVEGVQPVSASTIQRQGYEEPRELTISEIKDIVIRFAKGADRAKRAGFDGIEIHAGHWYLIAQFLARALNKRQDEYGGSLKNRARLLLEIIEAIKEQVGTDYPVWAKINGKEYGIKDGITLEEAQEVAVMGQEAGLDALQITGQPLLYPMPHSLGPVVHPYLPLWREGHFLDLAEKIKKVVKIPVIAVGRMTPEIAEKALGQNKIDFIAVGRQLVADPEFPKKLAQGRLEDVRPCLSCSGCIAPYDPDYSEPGAPQKLCTVNPSWLREREYVIKRADNIKRVLVVGGGPAGMEAARVSALRGHEVILYEKAGALGGLLRCAALFNPELEKLTKYLKNQVRKLGIKINLGKEFTPAMIEEINPDALILAVGAASVLPEIPGVDRENVISLATIQDLLAKRPLNRPKLLWRMGFTLMRFLGPSNIAGLSRFISPFGKQTLIIGSGFEAYEMAHFLIERGKNVTIVDTRESFPSGMPPMYVLADFFLDRLTFKNVPMLTEVEYEEITNRGLVINDKQGWLRTIEADTIAVVGTRQPNKELAKAFDGKVSEVYLVGDCDEPWGTLEAVRASYRIARAI